MPRKKVTVYTIQAVGWEDTDEYYYRVDYEFDPADDEFFEGYGGMRPVPLRSFLTREKAEANLLAEEQKQRVGLNPFNYGGLGDKLSEYTSMPARTFTERVQ